MDRDKDDGVTLVHADRDTFDMNIHHLIAIEAAAITMTTAKAHKALQDTQEDRALCDQVLGHTHCRQHY